MATKLSKQTTRPGSTPLSALRRRVFRLLFVLLIVLLLGLFLEGTARVYWALTPHRPAGKQGYPLDLFVWHETREYAMRPNFEGVFSGHPYADIPIEINSDGYRDESFTTRTPGGAKRIVFLGDSVVFGSGVRAESRFSNLFVQKAHWAEYESLNLSVSAYTFFHYMQQIREDIPKYDADVVVIGFCLNDLAPKETCWPRNHVFSPEGRCLGEYPTLSVLKARAKELSAFIALLAQAKSRMRSEKAVEQAWTRWIRTVVKAWQDERLVAELRRRLIYARDELHRQNRHLIVLVLPEKDDLDHPDQYGGPRRRMLGLLRELAIEYLDPFPRFRTHPDTADLFLPGDPVHFTPAGHDLIADVLAERLRE